MKKKIALAGSFLLAGCLLCGCGNTAGASSASAGGTGSAVSIESAASEIKDSVLSGISSLLKDPTAAETTAVPDTQAVTQAAAPVSSEPASSAAADSASSDPSESLFSELSDYAFSFLSGAGAWSTDFTLEADGSFSGLYHDADMGAMGEGYPNGTLYYCAFSGHFTDVTQIDEYTYEMTLGDISYVNTPDTQEILDQTLYIYTDAYGLTGTEKFLVYLPGCSTDTFSEDVRYWIHSSVSEPEIITTPVIVNEDQQEGFSSYPRFSSDTEDLNSAEHTDAASQVYETALAGYQEQEARLSSASSDEEKAEISASMKDISDGCLNELWGILKEKADDSTFQPILEEQRSWNSTKETQAQAASDAAGGGSASTAAYNTTFASMTMDRCQVLLSYIQGL